MTVFKGGVGQGGAADLPAIGGRRAQLPSLAGEDGIKAQKIQCGNANI